MDNPSVEPTPVTDKAGPWIRLGARIIDGLVLLIPTLIITAPFGGQRFGFGGDNFAKAFVAGVLATLLQYAYFVLMESSRGATLGKQVCGLRVDAGQEALTTESAAKRNAWMLLGLVPLIGGLIELVVVIVIATGINSDPLGQGPHDRFAGLRVSRKAA